MKVVHIVACQLHSGAGRAIRSLHENLLSKRIESHVLGRIELDLPKELNPHPVPLWKKLPVSLGNRIVRWRLKRRYQTTLHNFHPVGFGLNLHRSKIYREADIIHVQFAGATTMGPPLWKALKNEHRPVIWTLRDMWTFTGGCHFSADCQKYHASCGGCPQLGNVDDEKQTSKDLAFKKAHIGSNTTFVAISKIIAQQSQQSSVLQGCEIRVIPNTVMLDRFEKTKKEVARQALGLPENKIIISAGALNLADPRKGSESLAKLLEAFRNNPSIHWAIFGQGLEKLVDPVPKNCTFFGLLDNDTTLNQIYSASNVYLMPSLQESFGKTTVEAMASGTPVIAYDNTPAAEMIQNDETGWLVPHDNQSKYLTKTEQAIALGAEALAKMGEKACEYVHAEFSLDQITQQHISLYNEKLKACSAKLQ